MEKRILLVEDEEHLIDVIKLNLELEIQDITLFDKVSISQFFELYFWFVSIQFKIIDWVIFFEDFKSIVNSQKKL